VPGDENPLSIESMEEARAAFERVCDDRRLLVHGQAMPNIGTPDAALDAMSAAADAHDLAAWKVYTHVPGPQGFWLDDHESGPPQVGEGFLRRVEEIGIPIVCVHKGLGGGSRFADPVDVGPAAAAHPDLSFVVYHSGYETGVQEGPYDPARPNAGIDRLLASLDAAGIGPGGNVWCELGSTWRAVMGDPDQAAHVLGKLLVAVGEDRVVWGTDSIWYGTPQDQIQAFRAFQISSELQERHGYPELTPALKAKVLGLTSSTLYGVDPVGVPCTFARDELEQLRLALPSARTLGPETLAEHARVVAAHRGFT
jgi:predicted TIM-barrel fold metal-dependent hydrolase